MHTRVHPLARPSISVGPGRVRMQFRLRADRRSIDVPHIAYPTFTYSFTYAHGSTHPCRSVRMPVRARTQPNPIVVAPMARGPVRASQIAAQCPVNRDRPTHTLIRMLWNCGSLCSVDTQPRGGNVDEFDGGHDQEADMNDTVRAW